MRFFCLRVLIFVSLLQPAILAPALDSYRPFFSVAAITGLLWFFSGMSRGHVKSNSLNLIRNGVLCLAFFESFPALLQMNMELFNYIGMEWLKIVLVFCFIIGMVETEDQIPALLLTSLFAVAWIMFEAQQIYLHSFETLLEGRLGAYGMYSGANDYGLLLTCSIPLILKLSEFYESKALKILLFSMLPFGLFHIYLTGSRGSLIGATVALVLSVRTRKNLSAGQRKLITILIVLSMTVGGVKMIKSTRGEESLSGSDTSAESRLDAWAACGRMLFHNPFGVGFDQSIRRIRDYDMDERIYPHNTYVKVAAEAGIPGYIAYVTILYVVLSRLMKLEEYYRRIAPHRKLAIIQALLFSLIAFMINTSFSQKESEWLLYILLGCSARLISIESPVIEPEMEQQLWTQRAS